MMMQTMQNNFTDNASSNAQIFKPLAILCVVFGHFYDASGVKNTVLDYWWSMSTIGLIYFALCSSYFTAIKYGKCFVLSEFWKNKLLRLGVNILVVNLFLFALFAAEGKNNILSPHTLVHMFGLSGFLNWFGVQNTSPFGAGLWFLTLLFIFYALYPLFGCIYRSKYSSVFTLLSVVACLLLHIFSPLKINHALFLTASGYFIGMYLASCNCDRTLHFEILTLLLVLFLFAALNFAGFKILNGTFLVAIAVLFFMLTQTIRLKSSLLHPIKNLRFALLEIFMLHGYLFIFPTSFFIINFVTSIFIVLATAIMLSLMSQFFTAQLRYA